MQKILLFINTKASQAAETYSLAAEHFQKLDCEVIKGEAKSPDDYCDVVRKYRGQIDKVCLGGGDGTLQCASEVLLETQIPLGILPLGTANNVARSLNIPLTLPEAVEVAVNGKVTPIDIARVNGRIFLSVVGMGLSTVVHDQVPDQHKKRFGSLAYAWQALRMLGKTPPSFRAKISSDEHSLSVKALQITVCNGRYYGAHIQIHPEATLQDSLLDLSVIDARKPWRGLFKALLPLSGTPHDEGLKLLRSRSFHVTTKPSIPIDVEGMTDLRTPAHFEVFPGALRVVVPN
ncbi:MAG: YegS/Rv2252/BmrU family lipid kinase [Verrucomicrobiota bacterium]